MIQSSKGVFLSYASEDGDAAKRICDALRNAGIEVWFDQSELRGGDTWDHKIRQQIRDCALFVPIISAHTQRRPEGYFRLEWKLAVDRSHLIATEKAFLVPVVVDGIAEPEALVPPSFREVQWIRMPAGEVPPQLVDRIAALLAQPLVTRVGSPEPGTHSAPRSRLRTVLMALAGAALVGLVIAAALHRGWPGHTPVPKVAAGTASVLAVETRVAIPEKSIAVLPFVDMSERKNQEYFADGLSEEIIGQLSHVQPLRVIARTSSFYFKGRNDTIAVIGSALHVTHVLEGSVRKSGTHLRITAQLVRTFDSSNVWSQTYERSMAEVFTVQAEIASQVAVALQLALAPESGGGAHTLNVDAYNQLLQGQYFQNRWQEGDLNRAISAYREALRLDPNYLDAWLGLADTNVALSLDHDREAFSDAAQRAVRRALQIDPGSARAHHILGNIAQELQWDLPLAASEYQRALALAPNRSESLRIQYAVEDLRAMRTGSYGSQYWQLLEEGARLNPLDVRLLTQMAFVCVYGGQLQKGIDLLNRAYALNPAGGNIGAALSYAHLLGSRVAEARRIADGLGQREDARQVLTMIAWSEGNHAESNRRLAELERHPASGEAFTLAQIHAWRGERDAAFQYLDRAVLERDPNVLSIQLDPIVRRLKDDSRFQVLVRRLGLGA